MVFHAFALITYGLMEGRGEKGLEFTVSSLQLKNLLFYYASPKCYSQVGIDFFIKKNPLISNRFSTFLFQDFGSTGKFGVGVGG